MTAVQISALCFALSVLPTAQQSTPPQVELDRAPVSSGRALDWKGKRLNEIVPPASVKRIVRTNSDNFGGAFDISQATFNALFAKLFSSPERADDCAVASNEWMLAEFSILAGGDELFQADFTWNRVSVSAVLLRGRGNRCARIKVSDFILPSP